MEIVAFAETHSEIVSILDLESGDPLMKLTGHTDFVACISFSPCGTLLTSVSRNSEVILWDCQWWTRIQSFSCPPAWIWPRCFSSSGDQILLFSNDINMIRLWNIPTNTEVMTIGIAIYQRSQDIRCVCFHSTSNVVTVASSSAVTIYDTGTGAVKRNLTTHRYNSILTVDFNQDGSILASGSDDAEVVLWDVALGNVLRVLAGHMATISQVYFNLDGSRLVSGSWDKTACIWDVSTGECLLTLTDYDDWIKCCCFSEDGSKVITGDEDGSIKLWDSQTGEKLMTTIRSDFMISGPARTEPFFLCVNRVRINANYCLDTDRRPAPWMSPTNFKSLSIHCNRLLLCIHIVTKYCASQLVFILL